MNLRRLFKNQRALETLVILVIGVVFIQIVALFIFSNYQTRAHHKALSQSIIPKVERTIRLARLLPIAELPQHFPDISSSGMILQLADKPVPNSQTLLDVNSRVLRYMLRQNFNDLLLSVRLNDTHWLIIQNHVPKHPYLVVGFIASIVAMLIVLLLLCLWVVQRLSMPLQDFAEAVQRFGQDVQAPPMAEMGPPEMREVAHAFNRMQNRVRRLLDDRTQMLAAISHDLRTPITRLQLRAEYLKDTPQYEKAIADLKEMEYMIASILSFARDYTSTEVMEHFDLNALIETICNDLADTGKAVVYQSDDVRRPFFGRLMALKRAITNLIENAVKYGNEANVSLVHNGHNLQIKIEDQGPGIPEDKLVKVFQPFYRVDSARTPNVGGAGLGLAVARDIISAHGGEIRLFNRKPKGLTALVTLPYA